MRQEHNYAKGRRKQGIVANMISAIVIGFILTFMVNLIMWQLTSIDSTIEKIQKAQSAHLSNINMDSLPWFIGSFKEVLDILTHKVNKNYKDSRLQIDKYLEGWGIASGDNENSLLQKITDGSLNFVTLFLSVAMLMLLKLITIAASLFLYTVCGLIGLLDGLVDRYKRTMQAGRESTFVFHHVSKLVLSMPALIVFIYIVSPFYISPVLVNIVIAALIFAGTKIYGANLKKYM